MSRKVRKGLTLDVALEYLKERKDASPGLIDDMQKIAAEYKGRDRVFDAHQEANRIERQRTLFAMIPDGTAVGRFKEAMIDRAWTLLDGGQTEACDALLEFVPSKDADKMLDEYFADDAA